MSFLINSYQFALQNDPDFASVTALMHFDGTNGSTTFTDEIGNVWTATSPAQLTTTSPIKGTASGLFDGSTARLLTPDSANFDLGTGDFTIEISCITDNATSAQTLYSTYNGASGGVLFYINNTDIVFRWGDSQILLFSVTGGIQAATEMVISAVRDAGVLEMFLDGVSLGTQAFTTNINFTNSVSIGAFRLSGGSTGLFFDGKLDEFRITKGVARYSGSYTPLAQAFPDS